ncbi:MAG TPA: iron-containing alcohol dehydrogenase [Thermoplasmata archaeon]|nr:iron-containing alcohol dehydrogenase [Thermoplasmata archaeon]
MVGFVTVPAIVWGTGAPEQLSGLGARRAAVVVDPAVAAQEGPRRVLEELERGGASVTAISDRSVSNRLDAVAELATRLRGADPDWVIVVGGGTAIDGAKAARLLLERPDLSLEQAPVDLAVPERPRTRLAAVPTTSGSGAEASWVADVVASDGTPIELAHRTLVPDWAIVDPKFAEPLPTAAVVAGAFETAALACEAYVSAWANPFSDALAVDALKTVVRRLTHAVRWSDDPDARAALHYAATEAGIAQSNAQRGLAHALARALVRPTGLPYADLLAIVLPFVLDFDRPAARERLDALGEALRLPDERPAPSVADRLRRLAASAGAPTELTVAGASGDQLEAETPRIVAETLRSPAVLANPKVPTAKDVEQLLAALLPRVGADPDRARRA